LELDISQVQGYGDTFFSRTDVAYLVFLIIGIVGYFTVPSVANYIVHAGGGGALGQKVTSVFSSSSRGAVRMVSGGAGMAADAMGNAAGRMSQSMASHGKTNPYFGDSTSSGSAYMGDKLKGNS